MSEQYSTGKSRRKIRFVSWRWRIVLPLFGVVVLVAMVGAYAVAAGFGGRFSISQDNILLESVRGVNSRAGALYRRQFQEAQRVAFTIGVPEAVQLEQVDILQDSLEALARAADLDSLILTNAAGVEVLGVQRVIIEGVDDYAVNSGTSLATQNVVITALAGEAGDAALFRTPEGTLIYVSVPLLVENEVIGVVLAGNHLADVATELHGTAVAQVAVYSPSGELAETTYALNDTLQNDLRVTAALMEQALTAEAVPLRSINVEGVPHRAAYVPLNYGNSVLGVVAVMLPDSLPFATEMGRQLVGLMAATITGAALTVVFLGVAMFAGRVERVGQTAQALARGDSTARTGMQPTDEAGAVGAALDTYAERVQGELDALQAVLRRQRRETNHFVAVLQAMPEGVVVQDPQGGVTFVNDEGRRLLGDMLQNGQLTDLQQMSRLIEGKLGEAIMPGVYTIGDPKQVQVNERMLHAQAAVIQTVGGERVGTVLVLRDITEFVRREQARERLLSQVEEEVKRPLDELAQTGAFGAPPINAFAREITTRAVALQKLMVEMRELTTGDWKRVEGGQKIIRLDTLVWTIANDWRQIAQAADLKLMVAIEKNGLHILGDEKRLRWAIGNLLDNAIKYTLPGGAVTLEVQDEMNGQVVLRIRDSGVGIHADELPHVTTRFYRGNPTMVDGDIIRVPGMGRGLYIARMIIEGHGGFLRVRSKLGVGTAVYFSLPVTAAVMMDLPIIEESFEGETVRLPEDYLPDLKL